MVRRKRATGGKHIVVAVKDLDSDKRAVITQIVTETYKVGADYSRRNSDYDLLKIEKAKFLDIMRDLDTSLREAAEENITKKILQDKIDKKEAELASVRKVYSDKYGTSGSWFDGDEDEEE